MKHFVLIIITLFFFCSSVTTNAQCSGCNMTVSGLSTTDHYVGGGQFLCITSTGTITGNIYVSPAGNVCNQGNVLSNKITIDDGGTLFNYKNINTNYLSVLAGAFYNEGVATIDTFLITQQFSNFINDSILTGDSFTLLDHVTATNNGSITVNDFRDSSCTITNENRLIVNHNLSNENSSNFVNNGLISIGNDFTSNNMSFFTCNNYMQIQHDFFNDMSATFVASCMLTVNNNWTNHGILYGSNTGCGGFNVGGISKSTSHLGLAGTYLDICDSGHPTNGIDYPWGGVESTTTFCSCNNTCSNSNTSVKQTYIDNIEISEVYPNPSNSLIYVNISNIESTLLKLSIKDVCGKTVINEFTKINSKESKLNINISTLDQGTYILTITDSAQLQTKRLFTVVK